MDDREIIHPTAHTVSLQSSSTALRLLLIFKHLEIPPSPHLAVLEMLAYNTTII
jgi:hypothetical protein